jgi:hypothetical protein
METVAGLALVAAPLILLTAILMHPAHGAHGAAGGAI